ncbi:MAG: hypothetical protein M0P69_20955 [Bacteroidales bacterium]|jgi:hypothetical protein|nr:hypothetical protein [Bacteroidales bacterium]
MYYAQIDLEDGICFAVTETSGVIKRDDMLEIDSNDISLLGKKYVEGAWEVVEP